MTIGIGNYWKTMPVDQAREGLKKELENHKKNLKTARTSADVQTYKKAIAEIEKYLKKLGESVMTENTFRKSTVMDEDGSIAKQKEDEIMKGIEQAEEKYAEDHLTFDERKKEAEENSKLYKKVKYDNQNTEYNRW